LVLVLCPVKVILRPFLLLGTNLPVLPVEQEKLKEKKPTMTEALTQTLQAMHKAGCLNLVDVVEGRFKFDYLS